MLRRFPGEFEFHSSVWLSWPTKAEDWPGKFKAIPWVYAEVARWLSRSEQVQILCSSDEVSVSASRILDAHRVPKDGYQLHRANTDSNWLRDIAPTAIVEEEKLRWLTWGADNKGGAGILPEEISAISDIPLVQALRPDSGSPLVFAGGAINADGRGTVLTTDDALHSPSGERNPGLTHDDYETAFRYFLGAEKTVWLIGGYAGGYGQINNLGRFVAPGVVVLSYEEDPLEENFRVSQENFKILQGTKDARGNELQIVKLPMPEPVFFGEKRLPASYANFYIGNSIVLCPTFNDPLDRVALEILEKVFPERTVVGIHSLDLVLGSGALHSICLPQPVIG